MKARTEKKFVQINHKLSEDGRDLTINVSREAMSLIKRAAPGRLAAVKHSWVNSLSLLYRRLNQNAAKPLVPIYEKMLEIYKNEAANAPDSRDGNLVLALKSVGAFTSVKAKEHVFWLMKYNVFRTNLSSKVVQNVLCDATKLATRENDIHFIKKLGKLLSRRGLDLPEDTPPSDWEVDRLDQIILANWVANRHPLKFCFVSDEALFDFLKSEAKDANPTMERVRNCIKKLKLKRPLRPAPIRYFRVVNGEMYLE